LTASSSLDEEQDVVKIAKGRIKRNTFRIDGAFHNPNSLSRPLPHKVTTAISTLTSDQTQNALATNRAANSGFNLEFLSFAANLRNNITDVVIVTELAKDGKRNMSINPASEKIRLERFSN
jgi:hypothetical protein